VSKWTWRRSAFFRGEKLLCVILINYVLAKRFNAEVLPYVQYYYPVPVVARFKAWFCGRLVAGIVRLNPSEGMDVCLLWVLWAVGQSSSRRAGYSFRGVPPIVVCVSECDCEALVIRRPWHTSCCASWGGGVTLALTLGNFSGRE